MLSLSLQHCAGSNELLCTAHGIRAASSGSSTAHAQTGWCRCWQTCSYCRGAELVRTGSGSVQHIQGEGARFTWQKKVIDLQRGTPTCKLTHNEAVLFNLLRSSVIERWWLWSRVTSLWLKRCLCSWWAGCLWWLWRTLKNSPNRQEPLQRTWSRPWCTGFGSMRRTQTRTNHNRMWRYVPDGICSPPPSDIVLCVSDVFISPSHTGH